MLWKGNGNIGGRCIEIYTTKRMVEIKIYLTNILYQSLINAKLVFQRKIYMGYIVKSFKELKNDL